MSRTREERRSISERKYISKIKSIFNSKSGICKKIKLKTWKDLAVNELGLLFKHTGCPVDKSESAWNKIVARKNHKRERKLSKKEIIEEINEN